MDQFESLHRRLGIRRIPGWQLALIGAAVLAIVVTLAVVTVGVFLIVFPAILFIGLLCQLVRKLRPRSPADRRHDNKIIEVEYHVIDKGTNDPSPRP